MNALLRSGWLYPQNPSMVETNTLSILAATQQHQAHASKNEKDIFLLDLFPVWNFVSVINNNYNYSNNIYATNTNNPASNAASNNPSASANDDMCIARVERIAAYCETECQGLFVCLLGDFMIIIIIIII
jgi:hypothetical protein